MPSSHSDAIAFLAPGLVHQFGNLLLTIQGHALQLNRPAHSGERAQQAILTASERGGASLRILRILMGETGELLAPVTGLLEMFGELARVPVREAGHRLELLAKPSLHRQVAANEFFPAVTAAVQLLLGAAPKGMGGRLRIELLPSGNNVDAEILFVAESGSLPFPLQLSTPVAALALTMLERGDRTVVHANQSGLRLHFAGLPIAGEPCSDLHDSLPGGH